MVMGLTPRMFGRAHSPALDRPLHLLDDGQILQLGDIRVTALHTPGHTPGSMSYLVNERMLFTGDTLSLRGGWVAPFVRMINMEHTAQLASIHKLATLEDVEILCTGHSGYTTEWTRAISSWRA
jgi:glyoxylase-like metal-dependent hydrolase (beta-lactamase superfamily II)